jgi:uncharacterized RDD family membrane protein YckC
MNDNDYQFSSEQPKEPDHSNISSLHTAGFGRRALNTIVDSFYERLFSVLALLLLLGVSSLFGFLYYSIFHVIFPKIPMPGVFIIVTVGEFIVFFSYYYLLELRFGKTLGKYASGTKVVMQDGSLPTHDALAKRTLLRLVPFDLLSGLFNQDKLFWHDKYSGTKVVVDSVSHSKLGPSVLIAMAFIAAALLFLGNIAQNKLRESAVKELNVPAFKQITSEITFPNELKRVDKEVTCVDRKDVEVRTADESYKLCEKDQYVYYGSNIPINNQIASIFDAFTQQGWKLASDNRGQVRETDFIVGTMQASQILAGQGFSFEKGKTKATVLFGSPGMNHMYDATSCENVCEVVMELQAIHQYQYYFTVKYSISN